MTDLWNNQIKDSQKFISKPLSYENNRDRTQMFN